MEDKLSDNKYLSELISDLERESLTVLNLDEMKDRLIKISLTVNEIENVKNEHLILRTDYEQRIGGMVKAIAAVDRKRSAPEDALMILDELPQLNVTNMLGMYKKISSRFRDCFPSSFVKPGGVSGSNWEEYK